MLGDAPVCDRCHRPIYYGGCGCPMWPKLSTAPLCSVDDRFLLTDPFKNIKGDCMGYIAHNAIADMAISARGRIACLHIMKEFVEGEGI